MSIADAGSLCDDFEIVCSVESTGSPPEEASPPPFSQELHFTPEASLLLNNFASLSSFSLPGEEGGVVYNDCDGSAAENGLTPEISLKNEPAETGTLVATTATNSLEQTCLSDTSNSSSPLTEACEQLLQLLQSVTANSLSSESSLKRELESTQQLLRFKDETVKSNQLKITELEAQNNELLQKVKELHARNSENAQQLEVVLSLQEEKQLMSEKIDLLSTERDEAHARLNDAEKMLAELKAHHDGIVKNNTDMCERWQEVKRELTAAGEREAVLTQQIEQLRSSTERALTGSLISDVENKDRLIAELRERVDHLTAKMVEKDELLEANRRDDRNNGRVPSGLDDAALVDVLRDKTDYIDALESEVKALRTEAEKQKILIADKDEIIKVIQEESVEGTRMISERDQQIRRLSQQLRQFGLDRVQVDNI